VADWLSSVIAARQAVTRTRRGLLSASGYHALRCDPQKMPFLHVGAIDDDVLGEHETALEGAPGNAAVQHLGLVPRRASTAGNEQGVVPAPSARCHPDRTGDRHGENITAPRRSSRCCRRIGCLGTRPSGVVTIRGHKRSKPMAVRNSGAKRMWSRSTSCRQRRFQLRPPMTGRPSLRPRDPRMGHPGQP